MGGGGGEDVIMVFYSNVIKNAIKPREYIARCH